MSIRLRFAPSPTGYLHIGNIRAALYNWLMARGHNGHFMLRVDDTDQERSTVEYEEAGKRDLQWLGLNWDSTDRQLARMDVYSAIAEKLKAAGRIYPCYESKDELELKRKAQLGQGLPPVYDRTSLNLTADAIAKLEAEGRKPHWRFKLDWEKPIRWDDAIQGQKEFNPSTMSDPVIIREDGLPLYNFCSIIDDINDEMTHLVRGEDHISNTALQIQIAEAVAPLLGKTPSFNFAHFPRLATITGEKMSKRLGTMSVAEMRDEIGLEAMAITTYVARLGTSLPMEPTASLADLAASFDLGQISRNPPKVDMEELKRLNGKILHETAYDAVAERLAEMGVDANAGGGEAFWNAIRGELTVLADIKDWWNVIQGRITPVISDAELASAAIELLPAEPWDVDTFKAWTAEITAKTGKKGKGLFMPLRQALTAHEHGPELKDLLPLMGRARVIARLKGEVA